MKFLKLGICTSVQDNGRAGLLHAGINKGGVLDSESFEKNNLILGNEFNEAVVEIFFPGPEILFEEDGVLVITGADFEAEINGKSLIVGKQYDFKKGQMLCFRRKISGNVAYIGFKGGLQLPIFKDSAASFVSLNFNILEKNNSYHLKKLNEKLDFKLGIASSRLVQEKEIQVVFSQKLTKAQKESILQNSAQILLHSNRMGFRLKFKSNLRFKLDPIVSTLVGPGTIQMLPSGEIIILMADAQLTGGYPILGFVCSKDINTIAQMPVNTELKFKEIDLDTARNQVLDLKSEIDFIAKNIEIWR